MTDTTHAANSAKTATRRPRKMARVPKADGTELIAPTAPAKRESKADLVLGLLQRPDGATIEQLVAATGWLGHHDPPRGLSGAPRPDAGDMRQESG